MLDLRGVFNVTQVFPLTSSFDWILCLARKRVDLDEGSDGDGIDYLIGMSCFSSPLFNHYISTMQSCGTRSLVLSSEILRMEKGD